MRVNEEILKACAFGLLLGLTSTNCTKDDSDSELKNNNILEINSENHSNETYVDDCPACGMG